jgi:c-di-GMP-binding flagellar brake protein YcgR
MEMFLNQYVDERLERGVTSNVSPTGMYLHRALKRHHDRSSRYVQLEFKLPGTSEIIWARGEVRRDELELPPWRRDSELVHGSGVRLLEMPRAHRRMWKEFVHERKLRRVREILELIRQNRHH